MRPIICISLLPIILVGCLSADDEQPQPKTQPHSKTTKPPKMDANKRRALIQKIMAQYDDGAGGTIYPIVGVTEFFDGNSDEYSIAPNIVGDTHPGLDRFHQVLSEIDKRLNVQSVFIAILECPEADDPEDADMWPAAECVYVLTSEKTSEVEQWAKPLKHDGAVEGWSDGTAPPNAPALKPGYRVVTLTWD